VLFRCDGGHLPRRTVVVGIVIVAGIDNNIINIIEMIIIVDHGFTGRQHQKPASVISAGCRSSKDRLGDIGCE
jgi:hypothetical protein